MRGDIRLEVLAPRYRNYVSGVCDFCGDRFASHILTLRPQKNEYVTYHAFEHKFCDICFRKLKKAVSDASAPFAPTPLKP